MTKREHLYIRLMEECAEVQHRVSKLLQFGPDEIQEGNNTKNILRLRAEVDDLLSVIVILIEDKLLPPTTNMELHIKAKRERINKYLKMSQERGFVD